MASESKSRRVQGVAPKAPAKKPAAGRAHHRGRLGMDSEQSARVLLIGAVSVIMLIAFGFILFGYWYSVVRPRNRTVLQADNIKISYSAIKRRMAYELFQNVQLQQQPKLLPELTYQRLLEEATVLNRAGPDLGVSSTADEDEQKLRSRVGVGAEADQKQFADALLRQLNVTGLHDDEYRRMVRAELLTTKIKDKFKLEAPLSIQQARFDAIAVATKEEADAAAARVKNGEDWATVAKAVSQEVDVQQTGGAHDYTPQAGLNAAYESYVFADNTKIGDISAPLPSASGGQFFIVRVNDRADKPVTDDQKPKIADKQYNDWLVAQQDQMTVVRKFNAQDQQDALLSVASASASRIQQQRQQQQAPVQVPQRPQAPANNAPVQDQQPPSSGDQNPAVPAAPVAPSGQ